MIKYIELTAPEASAFRQCKIVSIECQEGQTVNVGDVLFIVKSGSKKIELPATRAGRITEVIADVKENISISTPLILLETEVEQASSKAEVVEPESSSAEEDSASDSSESNTEPVKKKKASKKKVTKKKAKKKLAKKPKSKPDSKTHKQQSLDLMLDKQAHETETTQASTEDITTMSNDAVIEISVPDIGTDSAKVIEILVQVGDQVEQEQALLTLENDKASMDVPSTHSGTIKSIEVNIDDDVSEGHIIVTVEQGAQKNDSSSSEAPEKSSDTLTEQEEQEQSPASVDESKQVDQTFSSMEVVVPDIGGDAAKVIEILVKAGDEVSAEDSLITLESDKASMDVPSPQSGVIEKIHVEIDQDVSEGTLIATLNIVASSAPAASPKQNETSSSTDKPVETTSKAAATNTASQSAIPAAVATQGKSHASPSIRRFARELGVDLSRVSGSGRKGRVLKDDVKAFVKGVLSSPSSTSHSAGAGIPEVPAQDFTKFGDIDIQPLNKIKRLTASNLHRSWLNVPHVTHNDEANITGLEAFRKKINADFKQRGEATKISPLAFIVKALVRCLREYPQFNASLEPGGENLIYKQYFNIGIAVDTPNGLVVPVIKNADQLSVSEIADQMGELAAKARDKKLSINDMSGACITISSLGGIGGTSFTPIVNAPEVAILGVSRSKMQPHWNGSEFEPALTLPLSLSYDHRVIDGAEAARFARHLADVLEDVRLLTI